MIGKISKIIFYLIFCIIKFFSCAKYCGIGANKYNVSYPPITNSLSLSNNKNRRNLQSNNFRSIQIYADVSHLERWKTLDEGNPSYDIILNALDYVINILQKIIKVKPLNYKIAIRNDDLKSWGLSDVKEELKEGNGVDKDLVIFVKITSSNNYQATFEQKYLDQQTKRPIVGIITFCSNLESELPLYVETMILHQFTHILGFYNESFPNFPSANGDITKIITTVVSDQRSQVPRTYIRSTKVLDLAEKYYNCGGIKGVELEDQDGRTNSHWEARTLLGEYMNSEPYYPEQVISEFTLALLEDSGWYEIPNYYTGGLMRYGKHKGCEFLNQDCLEKSQFKNEFFNKNMDSATPSCSSGRLSRTYCHSERSADTLSFEGFEKYNRLGGFFGIKIADFCLAFNSFSEETEKFGFYVGNCKEGNGNYGTLILYSDNRQHQNKDFPSFFGEKYDYNSFCVLTSISTIDASDNAFYKFDKNYIHSMCYPMFCSEKSLTIKVYQQYIVCPRSGGKVEINGMYEGYIFCPDYNLICTGLDMCNNLFDCIEKESKYKENTFDYDYEILTNQMKDELIDEYVVVGYELTDNGKCPKYCQQCKDIKKCFKCKSDFNLIGFIENDNNPIICNDTINVEIGYYQNMTTKVYYNCTEFCEKCNKTHCSKCNNIHKLDEYNKTCIDKVANCEKYDDEFICSKCKQKYGFIGNNRDECFLIDEAKYYALDDGISYLPCNASIAHCDICNNNPSKCEKCEKNYYFLESNRTYCRNDKDLSEYFSEDEKVSYFPCNTSVENCKKCTSRYACTSCFNNLFLIVNNSKRICSEKVDDTYYSEDGGKSYHSCLEAMENCERCDNKKECKKCFDDYGLFEKNTNYCVYIANNRYYTEDNGKSYYFCNKSLPLCEKCTNKNYCTTCVKNAYFVEYEKDRCYNDKNLSKYYTKDGGVTYFSCQNNCDTCYNESLCKSCISNYYFVEDDRSQCYKIDLEKYYSIDGGISYILCSKGMENCLKCKYQNKCLECEHNSYFVNNTFDKCYNIDTKKYYFDEDSNSYFPCSLRVNCLECFNKDTCNKCVSPYILLYESPIKCYSESSYENNREFFKLNESFYQKCSTSMPNCLYCQSKNYCEECDYNYYFINNNHSKCVLESTILPKDEYFKVDDKNYYSCSYKEGSVEHCKKCTNGTICIRCQDDYAFIFDNFKECINKKELEKKYYHNEDGTIYYPCIENCDICNNSKTCNECSPKYIGIYDDIECVLLDLEIINIETELEECNKYITSYINSSKNTISKVIHYVNNNYTITIFQVWEGTKTLIEKDYYSLNTKELKSQINNKFNFDRDNSIFCFISKDYDNYLEIYSKENGQKLDLNTNCPECITTGFEITNNYTTEIKNDFGITIYETIRDKNINTFNKKDPALKDICKNINIAKIDMSLIERRKYFNFEKYSREINCKDRNCEVQSINYNIFTGTCNCQINTDFEMFKNKNTKINIYNEINSYDISLAVFKCFKSGFGQNISSNTGFYLYLIFILLQIICFIIFLFFQNKKISFTKKINSTASPPSKNLDYEKESLFIEDLNIIEEKEENKNIKNFENVKKEIQDKDDEEEDYFEDISYNNDSIDDKNSQKTKLEEMIAKSSKSMRNPAYNNTQKQDTKDGMLEYNDEDDKMSKNQFISKKYYSKINSRYNFRSNENLRDFLSINKFKKNNRNKANKVSESFYLNTEGNIYNKTNNFKTYEKLSKLEGRNINSEKCIKPREQLIDLKDHISSIKRSIIASPYNQNNIGAENFSFCGFYWYLLGLKQPILNLTSEIKMFKITESFIPSSIKGIRFLFILALNFFINALLLSQKYFSNKFNYFDEKYNFRYVNFVGDVPTSERFAYAFKHTFINSLICLAICFVIQSILNYSYFNVRNKIEEIIYYHNKDEEILEFFWTIMRKYKFMFLIMMILMVIFFCYMTNFSAVYIGGDLDYISASILTFIFLQIIPFFICLILTLIRYIGIKVSSKNLLKISQIFAY